MDKINETILMFQKEKEKYENDNGIGTDLLYILDDTIDRINLLMEYSK